MPYATEFDTVVGHICYQKELQISDIFSGAVNAALVILSENPKDYSVLRKKPYIKPNSC